MTYTDSMHEGDGRYTVEAWSEGDRDLEAEETNGVEYLGPGTYVHSNTGTSSVWYRGIEELGPFATILVNILALDSYLLLVPCRAMLTCPAWVLCLSWNNDLT
jgi:hypothetical protein